MDEVVGTSGWKLAKPETVLFSGEGFAGWISWACAGDRGSQTVFWLENMSFVR